MASLQVLSSVWFWVYLIVFSMLLSSILSIFKIKKTMNDLHQSLTEGDEKINQNFEKISNGIDLVEREINQAVTISKNLAEHQAAESQVISTENITGSTQVPNTRIDFGQSPLRYTRRKMSKKFQKFLTPKGKIKKHYRDNPIAQECYEKFHRIKSSRV